MNKRFTLLLAFVFRVVTHGISQDTLSVLFLGNSYTAFNNLPQLVQNLSIANDKVLNIDFNMPGGYTVAQHVTNSTTINKISQGNWDYVVIQEQSQIPTIDFYRYNSMYPALADLKNLVEQYNPCAKLITYMTWGRRFGGQQCDGSNTHCSPVFTDFNHMQDSLTSAYTQISNSLKIQCAPVGVAWQTILNDTNLILHTTDNSHPNLDGSYVAALTIYSSIWKEPSLGNSFTAGLSQSLAEYYQQNTDKTVFHFAPNWNLHINTPIADFGYVVNGAQVQFSDSSIANNGSVLSHFWQFGDGASSTLVNPSHNYVLDGTYTVNLTVSNCNFTDTVSRTITVNSVGIQSVELNNVVFSPNPTQNLVSISGLEAYNNKTILLYNAFGVLIYSSLINSSAQEINLSSYPKGIYFLTVEGHSSTFRLVKN